MDSIVFQHQEYIDKAKKAINFYFACNQWSGLKKSNVDNWLANFSEDLLHKYYAIRLLSQLLYYSENDMVAMLSEGIFNGVLSKEVLLSCQVPSGFKMNQQDLQFEFRMRLNKTLFVPLLDSNQPYESGNQISRILTQQLRIPTPQVTVSTQINDNYNSLDYLIIVDDCIGSGDQCRDFWNEARVSNGNLLSKWCEVNNIKAYYVVLIGYEDNIKKLEKDLPSLNICCVELLQEEHKIFSENSVIWHDSEEMKEAFKFFSGITEEFGLELLGYNDLDFAVIMHKNIPDWSLPMFWRKVPDWDILLERKNSHG
ncbi:MAG TPA: hypothetical protein VGE40_05715 [Bacilli bacterium]